MTSAHCLFVRQKISTAKQVNKLDEIRLERMALWDQFGTLRPAPGRLALPDRKSNR